VNFKFEWLSFLERYADELTDIIVIECSGYRGVDFFAIKIKDFKECWARYRSISLDAIDVMKNFQLVTEYSYSQMLQASIAANGPVSFRPNLSR